MENNIRNIRKSCNTKIIIVSDDKTILEKDIKDLYSDFEELKIISSSDSINYKNISENFCKMLVLGHFMFKSNNRKIIHISTRTAWSELA